jgi:hypothetical protein
LNFALASHGDFDQGHDESENLLWQALQLRYYAIPRHQMGKKRTLAETKDGFPKPSPDKDRMTARKDKKERKDKKKNGEVKDRGPGLVNRGVSILDDVYDADAYVAVQTAARMAHRGASRAANR